MTVSENYAEYQTNLYVKAMGCVTAPNGKNVFKDRIPMEKVRERFEQEEIAFWLDAAYDPATEEVVYDETVTKFVRLRDNRIMGKRGSDVPQRQYGFLADLAAGVTDESQGDLRVTAAGTTRNGGRAYLQIATSSVLKLEGLSYEPFINFGMSHDGSLAATSVAGINIFECANMVSGAFGRDTVRKARTRQTKNATDAMIIQKHKIMLELERKADEFDEAIRDLLETEVSDKQWSALLDELAPLNPEGSKNKQTRNENLRGELNALYTSDERVAPWNGTAFGVVQAVNTYDLWNRSVRKDNEVTVRTFDETLDGTRVKRENDVMRELQKVLATV